MEDQDQGPLAAAWDRVRERLERDSMRSCFETTQLRLMFFYGARCAVLALRSPTDHLAALKALIDELTAFDREIMPHAAEAAPRAAEPE